MWPLLIVLLLFYLFRHQNIKSKNLEQYSHSPLPDIPNISPSNFDLANYNPYNPLSNYLVVWQTYKTRELPLEIRRLQDTWKSSLLKYQFFDDADMAYFFESNLQNEFPTLASIVKIIPFGVMKADLWRYCILYCYGGVYSDIDTSVCLPYDKIYKLLKSNPMRSRIIIGTESDNHFCQWTIISEPRHPILKRVIELSLERMSNGIDTTKPHFVHYYTGPAVWTDAIYDVLGEQMPEKFPNHLKTDEIRKKYNGNNSLGIQLEDLRFFQGHLVTHFFGSVMFPQSDYKSWRKEVGY